MKNLITLVLIICYSISIAQLPEANLIFRLDYDNDFLINEGETAFYDSEGGVLSKDRFGIENNACTFNTEKQIVKFEEFLCIEKELTISLWIKFESFEGDRYPIVMLANKDEFIHGFTNKLGFEVHNSKTSLGYYNQTGGRIIYDHNNLSYDNQWHNLVGTISNESRIKMYVDNQYLGYHEFDIQTLDGLDQLIIGGGYDDLYGHLSIDDIRIYNRSLTLCEIDALYYEKDNIVDCDLVEEISCNGIVSVSEANSNKLKIYPNPVSNGIVTVEGVQSKAYQVFNQIGIEVERGTINTNQIILNKIPSGFYTLRIDGITKKLIVE